MSSSHTSWEIGAHARVLFHPRDDEDPPRVFMADASRSVTLVPPSDRDRYPEFVSFLQDLAESVQELVLECQSDSAHGLAR